MYTATQAIEQTVKARIKELKTGIWISKCPLCTYRDYRGDNCQKCPITIITGETCHFITTNFFHHEDKEMGVSFALALQYYWDIYKKTGETLK